MNRRHSVIIRGIALVLGLALVALGGAVLAWTTDLGSTRSRISDVTVPRVSGWPESAWWSSALVGVAVLAVVVSLWLLALTLSPRRVRTVPLPGSGDNGALTVDLAALAAAAAELFESTPGVRRAGHRVRLHRGVPTADLLVRCSPDADLDSLGDAARRADGFLAAALPGGTPRHRVFLHVDRIDNHDRLGLNLDLDRGVDA